jgi:hypothetical protein
MKRYKYIDHKYVLLFCLKSVGKSSFCEKKEIKKGKERRKECHLSVRNALNKEKRKKK